MPAPVPYSLDDAEGMFEASCEIVPGDVDELLLVVDETELTLTDVSIGRFAAALDDPLVDDVEFDVDVEGVTPPAKAPVAADVPDVALVDAPDVPVVADPAVPVAAPVEE